MLDKNVVFVRRSISYHGNPKGYNHALLFFPCMQGQSPWLFPMLLKSLQDFNKLSLLKSKILKAYCWRSLLFPKGKQSETIKGFAQDQGLLVSYAPTKGAYCSSSLIEDFKCPCMHAFAFLLAGEVNISTCIKIFDFKCFLNKSTQSKLY